ncbi:MULTISPECIES: type I restriction endonuclease [Cyanophyceae]|uniref:type I restriction endonuclease n=1 Tax=Cyanophyceae TaxID=3028117 RepID=UPI0002A669FA|nr:MULTISPECIES: type I restriction endonuclease [Cyanophyceae]AFZ33526.1 Restriction endonuclease, type I, EcoRI, R subunit/Type III [Gloeocapsa sp. PCC 7428]PPS42033.1 restriction endonuclease subunit R [Chroococcidiopsis sp. TS-821]
MIQTLQAIDITLHDLRTKFSLTQTEDEQFFREWQDDLPEIAEEEKRSLDRVKSNYRNLIEYPPLLEDAVKMVVLSPLLDLAGFYQSPFRIETETSILLTAEDEGIVVKGRIDVLVLNDQLWILVIESKKAEFSLEAARAQALAYMLASPKVDKPTFGLITNGGSFVFLKLTRSGTPQYALSRVFSILSPGNELYSVLSIMMRLGAAIQN